jgi:ribosomal protein S27E
MTSSDLIDVSCPQCKKRFTAPPNSSGTRVACPACGSQVKIAGPVASSNDDDAWLRLDDEFPQIENNAAKVGSKDLSPGLSNAAPTREVPGGKSFGQDPLWPSENGTPSFEDDALGEFRIPDLPPAPPMPGTSPKVPTVPPLSEQDLDALMGVSHEEEQHAAPVKVERTLSASESFRVKCPTCESLTYAKVSQVGKSIRCGDCHSQIIVPSPPKAKVKYTPDIESAKAFTFQDKDEDGDQPRAPEAFRKTASDYLRDAEAAVEEAEEDDWTVPSIGDWFQSVFGIFRDPSVFGYWVFFSAFAAVPTVIAIQFQSSIVVMGLFVGGGLLGAILIAHGFAIMQSLANGEEKVTEWPVVDFFAWIGPLFMAAAAVGVSAGPVWLAMGYFFGASLITVFMTMSSLYVLYPFVLLSMLDEQSVFSPFSAEVSKSVTRASEQWGLAYLSSGLLFAGSFFIFFTCSVLPSALGATIAIATAVATTFLYFGILGRLAFAIGQAVNSPPMVNDIKRNPKLPD